MTAMFKIIKHGHEIEGMEMSLGLRKGKPEKVSHLGQVLMIGQQVGESSLVLYSGGRYIYRGVGGSLNRKRKA